MIEKDINRPGEGVREGSSTEEEIEDAQIPNSPSEIMMIDSSSDQEKKMKQETPRYFAFDFSEFKFAPLSLSLISQALNSQ